MNVGRSRIRLAKLLQKYFPLSRGGTPVNWTPERIYVAQGWYRRRSLLNDSFRWEAHAFSEDRGAHVSVSCYTTIGECLKAGSLVMSSDWKEVFPQKT